ncbi:sulfurtransferase [Tissierella sp.]|uniref:sulfurtransferase n=1 Tax=Tissierella sp. TaxID=41274 RepID=UPI002857517A|nr:sulfurtransferase [Tissierella sp.]MDR7855567.1 sulfurtransferase [Tissierella sp.]
MKNIVSQEWLVNNMLEENLIILDVRAGLTDPDYGYEEYKEGHIKGAQFVSMEDTLTGKLGQHGGRHPLPNMEVFIENMKELGVNNDSTIIIYDDGDLSMAGRLWWMLKYAGKDKVFVLEGGIKAWIENGNELTTEIPTPLKSNSLTLNINDLMKVDVDYVKSAINSKDVAIVDARAKERYAGEVEPMDRIPGHIPNALNFPWMDLLIDGKVMDKESLIDHFKSLEKYEEVIVHCGSGITGTVNYMLMEEIGLTPRLYLGGYSDWVSYEDNEVVKD